MTLIPSSSIWSEHQLSAYPGLSDQTTHADVAVIGAGLTGLSVAYHLLKREPQKRIIVLEAGRIGSGASGQTTGILGPGVGQSLVSLVRRFGPECAQTLYRRTLEAVEYVQALITREKIACELEMTGQVIVARSPGGRSRLAAQAEILKRFNLPHEILGDQDLKRIIRLASLPGTQIREKGPAALRIPLAGILHPVRLLAGLAARVTELGGAIFEGARVTGLREGNPVRLEVGSSANVIADKVVIATAGYTSDLGVLRGRILPAHLQVLVTEPLSAKARELIGWEGREGILDSRRIFNYFRLTADNRIVFGGGEPRYRWGGSTSEDSGNVAHALDRLANEMTSTFPKGSDLTIARGWTGVIGYVLDALPAIHYGGTKCPILHLVGWCGHGVALSLAFGAWITSLICDGAAKENLPWYREQPPLVPFELVRWLGFNSSVKLMHLLDKVA